MVNPDPRDEERGNGPRISHLGLLRHQRLPLGLGHPQGVMEEYLAVGAHFSLGVSSSTVSALSECKLFHRNSFGGTGFFGGVCHGTTISRPAGRVAGGRGGRCAGAARYAPA